MNTCDDCGREYPGRPYYTMGGECQAHDDGSVCTDNIGPECAGPDLEPDDLDDPRREKREEETG